MKTTYVFINKQNPNRIKMIDATTPLEAYFGLIARLENEPESGEGRDYRFGYKM